MDLRDGGIEKERQKERMRDFPTINLDRDLTQIFWYTEHRTG